ncbi:lipopolysaccharide biosynthesis protein [Aquimarina sp. TRL1]|uniref:lipopolysaccharide biosynthesis protein n=1 Tax=Aquimarina sp. (strain TRL1) TaxID=2736252 RepID=UPI001589CF78|nr:lipopolysaccharide biosynthesis protein [Aquimarina sp. TRL1]QKX04713.1 lipopolysaccharide biosynthesis protein [Aquimarina sp. TRL1]
MGTKSKGLVKASFIYSIGNIGTLVLNFFLVPMYTFFLSQEELGFFDVIASSVTLISPLFFGHIESAVIRWLIGKKERENIGHIVSNSSLIFILGISFFSLCYFILTFFIKHDLFLFIYLYLIANFFYIIIKQVIRSVYSSFHYVITEVIFTVIVFVFAVFLAKEYKLKGILLAYFYSFLSLLVYLIFIKFHKYLSIYEIKKSTMKELLSYSIPLVPNTFSLWTNTMANKYIILLYLSLSSNGIYAIAFKIAYVVQILNRIFYLSLQDKMFEIYGKKEFEGYFSETFRKYSAILFSIVILLIASQKIFLPIVIDDKFLSAMNFIPILSLGVLFMSLASVIGIIYQCEKKNIRGSKTSMISGAVILVLGFVFIPKYGLYGASSVFLIGNLVLLFYRYIDVNKFITLKIRIERFIIYIVLTFLISLFSLTNKIELLLLNLLLAIVLALLINKSIVLKYYFLFINRKC